MEFHGRALCRRAASSSSAALVIAHKWLPAGRRRFREILPGIVATLMLWLATAFAFGRYLAEFAYTYVSYYAGLASVMIALVFLYLTASIFIYGGELNAAIVARAAQAQLIPPRAALTPPVRRGATDRHLAIMVRQGMTECADRCGVASVSDSPVPGDWHAREPKSSESVILVVGLIAGWLAGKIMSGSGFGIIGDIIVGVIGAFIGGLAVESRLHLPIVGHLDHDAIVFATIGAVILLFILRLIKRR